MKKYMFVGQILTGQFHPTCVTNPSIQHILGQKESDNPVAATYPVPTMIALTVANARESLLIAFSVPKLTTAMVVVISVYGSFTSKM